MKVTELPGVDFTIPKRAHVAGLGMVQVLSYNGNGYFMVLTNKDMRYLKHRDGISFRK